MFYFWTLPTRSNSKIVADNDGNFILTPGENDGALNVVLKKGDTPLFGGNLAVSGGSIGFNLATQSLSFTKGTKTAFTLGNYTFEFTATDDISSKIAMDANGSFVLTPGENDGSLNVVLKKGDTPLFGGNLTVSDGSIGFNPATQALSFTKGTKTALTLGNYTFEFTATDDISSKFAVDADGNFILTPGENDGSLNVVLKKGDTPIFNNNVSVIGEINFSLATQSIGLADGTKISTKLGDYEVTATADGDAAVTFAMTSAGLSITPVKGDGTLNLKLGSESGSLSANLEVLSGSFILGENGALTVTKDTELQIDFGGGYIVKFKTTDDAGGKISLGAGGLTFTPNIDDGHLELTITKGDETRSATLDVTGTVTYNLDGSISLAQGTVVKNHFNSGANLTITAKTDSDGSIIFNPSSGLTITNNLPGALKATLEHDTIFVFDDIIGSITYNSGKVTVHDGTTAVSWFEASDYQSAKGTCSSTGGDTMIDFASPMQVYSVAEGATYKVEEAEEFWELSRGNLCGTFYEGETVYLLTEGSVVNANESIKFLLESAGNYTLNGMKVTTTTNNAKVVLTDYDTIIVDGISYTPLDENVTLTIGENGATVAGGKVTMQMEGFDIALSEDVTDGSISYNSTTNKFTVKAGTKSYLGEGKFPDQFVAKTDFDISVTKTDDGKFKFSLGDESIAFDLTRNGKAIMGSTITL
ncbi:MAG: hypothetical protein IK120_06555, partial [Muribaculaceae bacterium]|nr:hypothetical protein [Muribaculaceae bacterium]